MIAIFARPSYLGNLYPKHTTELNTHRLSSRIRGEEIAQYAGFKLNEGVRGEDTFVWVKPTGLKHIQDGDYIDLLDGLIGDRESMLKDRPGINLIAASQNSYDYLKERYTNKIVLIPHQHINIENKRRERMSAARCGYIGSPSPQAFKMYETIGEHLKTIGMEFITCFNYKTRQDAIDFYMSIDILVVGPWNDTNPHKLPTKIINAASFGIPSIAYPLPGYREIDEYYHHADGSVEELFEAVNGLRRAYSAHSDAALFMSKKYHISRIAELYKQL